MERREIKQRSAAVWARAKQAYLAGETGASVARRFDVGYGNLRYRAHKEGWTRKAAMASEDHEAECESERLAGRADQSPDAIAPPPPVAIITAPAGPVDPREALGHATRAAARLLAEGRGAEASQMVRAAQGLAELMARDDVVLTPPLSEDADAAAEGELRKLRMELDGFITERADALARDMLGDQVRSPGVFGAFAYHWRAAVLGPEVAAADREQAVAKGPWAVTPYWDEAGALKPVRASFDRHWSMMRHQERGSNGMAYRKDEPEWGD